MIWIVGVLLGSLLVGGLLRLILFFRGRSDLLPNSEQVLGRERLLALAIVNISFGAFGLFLLVAGHSDPFDILIGTSIVGLIFEVGLRKGSVKWVG